MFGNSTISRLTGIGFIGLLLCGGFAPTAMAIPFKFTFTGTIFLQSDIPGVNINDPLTLVVVADNGGTTTISQTWGAADVLSANLGAGTYSVSYDTPPSLAGFMTDATGSLVAAQFADATGTNTDIFAGGENPITANGFIKSSDGDFSLFKPFTNNLSGWGPISLVPTSPPIPEPGTLALFGVGLAFCTVARRRTRNTRRS